MDTAMREKILELFEYRELPKLIMYMRDEWDEAYYEKLIQLQYDIYMLDYELETNWKVDMDIINQRWIAIYHDLEVLGLPKVKHDLYCKHIYKYQRHELDIRKGKLPTRLSMEYFYFYKSCDVKLLRRLIYASNPSLSRAIRLSAWRLFDLVTEVNDDVVDLQEDTSTINGNRFLISLKQFGKEDTIKLFSLFLEDVKVRNDALEVAGIEGINIKKWTQDQVDSTLELIKNQAEVFDKLDTSSYHFVPLVHRI